MSEEARAVDGALERNGASTRSQRNTARNVAVFQRPCRPDKGKAARPALSREPNLTARRLGIPSSGSGCGGGSPRPERFVSEDTERVAGCEMALDVEGVEDSGVNGQEALGWADPGDLNRCILRSRRRVGWCEFSARLFLREPWSWRADNPISDFAAP